MLVFNTMCYPKYRLVYFNGRGAAEHIRMIFAYAEVPYEDVRCEMVEWPQLKKEMPFGMLPILEIDKTSTLHQSNCIGRFLARRYGLNGRDEDESLQCDILVDTIVDFKKIIWETYVEKDVAKRAQLESKLRVEIAPYFLSRFEDIVGSNNTTGYSVGSQLTWTDFVFAGLLENLERFFGREIVAEYSSLLSLKEKVYAVPSIAKWIAQRPESDF